MKFEQLLNNFDMGVCVEQLQKESLLDLALLFVTVDGSIADEELNVVSAWAQKIEWNSAIEPSTVTKSKARSNNDSF